MNQKQREVVANHRRIVIEISMMIEHRANRMVMLIDTEVHHGQDNQYPLDGRRRRRHQNIQIQDKGKLIFTKNQSKFVSKRIECDKWLYFEIRFIADRHQLGVVNIAQFAMRQKHLQSHQPQQHQYHRIMNHEVPNGNVMHQKVYHQNKLHKL